MNKHITTDNLKTIFPPIQYMIDKKAEDLDWNENDPSSKGYIKNRPFYTYEKLVEGKYFVPETTFTGIAQDGAPIYIAELLCNYDVMYEVAATPETWISTTFNVIYDGVTYQASGKIFEGNGMPYIGNLYVFTGDESANTKEPFLFAPGDEGAGTGMVAVFDGNEHTISIQLPDTYETTNVKIDAKYLPEVGLGRKGVGENAEVYNGGLASQAEGDYSHAEGLDTIASGHYSHAEGTLTEALNYYAHAEGYKTEASGYGSHAEGYETRATGEYSHAEGYETRATGSSSHAEGGNSIASGDWSHAEGGSTASGEYSHSEGCASRAIGDRSHAEGWDTIASGTNSHAEGHTTKAEGVSSHAEGYSTTASGSESHAEGNYTRATGEYSHAEGYNNTASGQTSHTEGRGTEASGENAHAEGYVTIASGINSHSEGYHTEARGYASHAEGEYTIASSRCQHVQGQYNIEDAEDKYAHIVGNGSTPVPGNIIVRSNAHTIDWNGNGWFAGGIKIGGESQEDPKATEVATKTDINIAKNYFALKDEVNGLTYLISMRNGSIVSSCATTNIVVNTPPNKTTYMVGEYFDPTGMVVIANLGDGNTKEITDYTFLTNYITEEDTEMQIAYVEAGIKHTVNISISVEPFDPAVVLTDFNYTLNDDGTYSITEWKGTTNGEVSTEIIIPNNGLILV